MPEKPLCYEVEVVFERSIVRRFGFEAYEDASRLLEAIVAYAEGGALDRKSTRFNFGPSDAFEAVIVLSRVVTAQLTLLDY
jgi:hypothetical protein